jgi:subtilisin family serine protease
MYSFRYGGPQGREMTLVEATDLVVVRTENGQQLDDLNLSEAARDLASSLIPFAAFPEADVVVYQIASQRGMASMSIRNKVRSSFKNEKGIKFAGRVLKDANTGVVFIYTENFFVKFKDGTSEKRCAELLKKHQLSTAEKLVFAENAYFAKADEGTGLKIFEISDALLKEKEVEYCHPELVQEKRYKAVFPMQWHLIKTTVNGKEVDASVNIEEAWKTTKGKGITICVIDDGVDIDHPEFQGAGKVVFPRDTILNTDNARPRGFGDNHGTACAGVACANGTGKASGVAPEAKLMPIRCGGLGSISESKAFAWAADNGADVISCSWGPADGAWDNPNDPLHRMNFPMPDSARLAIDYALTKGRGGKGCVITWAAGNGNESVDLDGYAAYPPIIAVAACNDRSKRSVYSDFGKAIWLSFPSNDIFAPRINPVRPLTPGIWTTDRVGERGYNPGTPNAEGTVGDKEGLYAADFGGTSSACPGAAGVIALVLAVNPKLTAAEVKNLLRNSCDQIDPEKGAYDANGHSIFYGYGRINPAKAVDNAKGLQQGPQNVKVSGMAHFSPGAKVKISEGKWTSDNQEFNRLVGLELKLDPATPELSIQYRLNLARIGTTPWAVNGDFTGVLNQNRRAIGLEIRLIGPAASQFSVAYEAKIVGRTTVVKARDGQVCGSAGLSGSSIQEIRVMIEKRSS